jgi:peptidoglycan/LPS O-acetylase OafA/YrhL
VGGGFIGVDVFFVLSGYLVTQVLLRDLDGPGGRVGFGRFYARRVRRLLPAAVVAIVVTAAAYGAVASLASLDAAADSFKAALLYVANWYFIAESADYFAPQDPSPVLHFWSLAVEEQFYVVWPLLLSGLWALGGRRGRTGTSRRVATASLVAVAAVASFALAMVLRSDAPTRAYFGTDTRAYQLLVGAGLALLPGLTAAAARHRAGRVLAPAGLAAIVVTASSLLDLDPFARSAITTVAAAALIVGVEAHQRSATSRAFGFAPIAYLGTISYATYLWHWPIIVIIGELGILTSATTLALVTALLATGIAALSSELLELPIRRSGWLDGHRGTVIAGGVGISALAAILLVPVLVDVERSRVEIEGTGAARADESIDLRTQTPVPDSFSYAEYRQARFGDDLRCVDEELADCTVVAGDGPHILVIGDSNATMYVAALTEAARLTGARLSLAVADGCPWQLGFSHLNEGTRQACEGVRPVTYDRVIPGLDPDVILLINSPIGVGQLTELGQGRTQELLDATDDSLERLGATGAELVIVDPVPMLPDFDPLACLAEATYVEDCAFAPRFVDSWIDRELRGRAAASEQLHYVNWDSLVCPRLPVCDAIQGETPVFWNQGHLTAEYSALLGPAVARELAALGLVPAPPRTG